MKKIDKDEQYTKDFLKWQNNQYNPGAYLGGNFPIDVKHGGKKNRIYLLIQSTVILFFGLLIILEVESKYNFVGYILVVLGLIFTISLVWRLYFYKKRNKPKK